jgi:hypothetical protein
LVDVGIPPSLFPPVLDINKDNVTLMKLLEKVRCFSCSDGLCIDESILVKSGRRKSAYHGSHPVLDVQEIRLDAGIQKSFEKGSIEESYVGILADASGWQLVRISKQ